jgi:hypothetical protein
MKQIKVAPRSAGPSRLLSGLLVGLTLVSVLVADQALASRRGRGGLPPGITLRPLAPAPAVAQASANAAALPVAGPAERPQPPKPLLHPTRHGTKPRGVTR